MMNDVYAIGVALYYRRTNTANEVVSECVMRRSKKGPKVRVEIELADWLRPTAFF